MIGLLKKENMYIKYNNKQYDSSKENRYRQEGGRKRKPHTEINQSIKQDTQIIIREKQYS